jgi:hypothetical protein
MYYIYYHLLDALSCVIDGNSLSITLTHITGMTPLKVGPKVSGLTNFLR